MKYTADLREKLKRDFPKYADMPVDKILAYYEESSLPELNSSVLIFEREDGRPYIAAKGHDAINIPFKSSGL
jgi:hypothetical protein